MPGTPRTSRRRRWSRVRVVHAAAIVTLAALAVAAFLVSGLFIGALEGTAGLVNHSGRLRMLTERIVRLGDETGHAATPAARKEAARALLGAADQLALERRVVSSRERSVDLADAAGAEVLAAGLDDLHTTALELAAQTSQGRPLPRKISALSRRGDEVIEALEARVEDLEGETADRVARLRAASGVILGLSLAGLALLWLLSLRPAARRMEAEREDAQSRYRQL